MNPDILAQFLSDTSCYHCGGSLQNAEVTFLMRSAVAAIVHVRCSDCGSEILASMSLSGHSITDIRTDLTSAELKRFFNAAPVSVDNVLDLAELPEEKLWLLLKQKKEKYSERKFRNSAEKGSFPESSWKEEEAPSHSS